MNSHSKTWRVTHEEMLESRDWLNGMLSRMGRKTEQAGLEFIRQGWGDLQANLAVDASPLCLAGKVYKTGLGTHSESDLRLRLPPGCRRLTGLCGINDSQLTRGLAAPQAFSIVAGGRELWNSGPLQIESPPARFDVPLGGRREVLLLVRGPIVRAHVDWVDVKVDGQPIYVKEDLMQQGEIFGFTCGGKSSADLLDDWRMAVHQEPERNGMRLRRITRTDPKTGLAVICEVKEYRDFPVVEWVVRLKNTSRRRGPLIENLRSMDLGFRRGAFPYLHHWTGDYYSPDGYEQFRVSLAHGEEYCFAPMGGRGTNRAFPYYNLEWADTGRGVIAVVGWAGQWASRFTGDLNRPGTVRMTAGQELTRFRLLPGEEARTPSALLMFYHGDLERSQNLWRRFFRAHIMPRPAGKPMTPHLACAATDDGEEFTAATEANQVKYMAKFAARKIPFDTWWIDAGWYPCYNKERQRKWWETGTWEPDPERFPNGFKSVSDCAARHGADLLVWFEPERVRPGSYLDREHPEWLLKVEGNDDRLLNLGDPVCRKWITGHVCRLIRDNGIKVYRQDFNFEPLPYWRKNDVADRQGMTENLHVQGYLKYWDDLLARNQGLWIDSCASGGRRNDLDTMRRAVPLHYTDYGYGDHPVKLAFHNALFQWLVYFKEVTLSWDQKGMARFDRQVDSYAFHCGFGPMLFPTIDIRRDDYDFPLVRKMIAIWRKAAPLMLNGDYHALTPIHRSPKKWVARQFNDPLKWRGFIQAIRLPQAPEGRIAVYPKGLRPDAVYVFKNQESGETRKLAGAAVQQDGFDIVLPKREGAIWFYEKKDL